MISSERMTLACSADVREQHRVRARRGFADSTSRRRNAALSLLALTVALGFAAARASAADFDVPADLTAHAVLSCQDLLIAGNSVVTSEGVGAALHADEGHVRSNGDVRLDGSVEVHGDAVAGPGKQVILSGEPALVTGEKRAAATAFACAPLDLAALRLRLEASNDNARLGPTDKGKPALGGTLGRSLELSGQDGLTLPAGTYFLHDLRLSGNARLRVAEGAEVRILLTGALDVKGGSHLNLDGLPRRVRIWSLGASVALASQSVVDAVVYAPSAEVLLSGQSRLVGSLQAAKVQITGGSRVRRVIDDQPPALEITSPADGATVGSCTVTVSGRAADGEGPLTLAINGVPVAPQSDGSFSAVITLGGDDPGLIEAVATDNTGNVTRVALRVTIAPPVAELVSPAPGALVGTRVVDLSGRSGNATAVTVNGVAAQLPGDGTFRVLAFDLGEDGFVPLRIVASNCAASVEASVVLDLDTRAPVVAIDSPTPGALFGRSPITVSGTVEDDHLTGVTVNGVAAPVSAGRFTAEGVPLVEGANTLVAVATDALARSTSSAGVPVELDSTAPTVEITEPAAGAVVGETSITVRGQVSDANAAGVTVNGVAASLSGTEFVAVGVPLAEGANALVATALDTAGNAAVSPGVTVERDTLAPEVTMDAAVLPDATPEDSVTVTGTAHDAHLASVTVNGVAATIVGDEYAATVPLAEGANAIVARATDVLGHATETAAATVVRDSLPPQVAITEPLSGADLGSAAVTVRGTVSDPYLEQVTVRDVTAAVAGGAFEAGVELPEGPSDLVARAVDRFGHAADSAPVAVVVDSLPPVVRLDSPENPLTAAATVTVTGSAQDPHLDRVTVSGREATLEASGAFTASEVPLAEGPNEVRARALDSFGHEAESEPVVYVRDSTPPTIRITSPANGTIAGTPQVTVQGEVSDPHVLEVTVNGVAASLDETAGTFSAAVPLAAGANAIVAVARDSAGNEAQAAITVVLDTLPPAVTIDQPALAAGACLAAGSLQTLGGAFSDLNPATGLGGQPPAVQVEVRDASGAVRTYAGTLSSDGTRWTASGVDLGSADGSVYVTVTATDTLGHTARVSAAFRVDAGPPRVTLLRDGAAFANQAPGATAGAGETPVLFRAALAAAAAVEDGGAGVAPVAVLTLDGAPYAAGTPIASEGSHLLSASATDCAGHAAAVHALFAIDTTSPVLRSSTPAAGARLTAAPTTFSGTSDPDVARATVDGRAANLGAGGAFTAPYAWREGANTAVVELEDRAGNRARASVSFEVRTTALAVEILENGAPIMPNAVFLRPVRPEARSNDGAVLRATLNGAPFAFGSEIAQSGTYRLDVTATDDWARTAQASVTFTVDLGPPPQVAITSPADGAVLGDATVRVEGTVQGDQPEVSVNGVAAAVANGAWSVAALPLEADVSNTLVATARDRRGRTATAAITVRVVSGAPQIVILEPADGATTNRAAIDVAGAVVGGRARSADGTATVAGRTVELRPDGAFRALDVQLQTGDNTLVVSVRDREGRTGSAQVVVHADFTPPAVRFFADGQPLADGATFDRAITLAVEVSDDVALGGAPSIRLNGATQPSAAPRTEMALGTGGGYLVSVVALDAAGNETRGERSLVIGAGGCALSDVSPAAGSAVAGDTVDLVGRAGTAASVTVRVPQPGGGAQAFPAVLADGTFFLGDVPLPVVGTNPLELVCVDASGASHSISHAIERLDTSSGPQIDITSPAGGALTGADTLPVAGTTSGGGVTVNGLAAAVTPATGADAFQAASVPLTEGPNPLVARVVDAAGRSAEDRVVVARDSQAPRVRITRPDNQARVGIAGAGPAAIEVSGAVDLDSEPHLDRVVVATAQGSVTATVDPQTGVFVAAGVPLDAAASAAQTVTATAFDTLGHQGTASVEVTLDAAGPAIVVAEPADLGRYGAAASDPIAIRGEAWGAPGSTISLNGGDLDPATLPWEDAGPDGRRHVTFTASVSLPSADGAFGIVARIADLEGRAAQDRRLLYRDTQGPRVVELVPADGAAGVDPNGLVFALFSEPVLHASLDAADGLALLSGASGQPVAVTKTVAGQAVALAPGAALAADADYVLRAGLGITDLAGNPLIAPAQSAFHTSRPATGTAPALDALPAVLCADEIQVTGHAEPGVTVKVRDGDLTFTGFADSTGAFAVIVPVSGGGFRLLTVWSLDPLTGARSPETSAVVRIDCNAPSVVEARFDRDTGVVRIVFSEDMSAATLAVGADRSIRLSDADEPGVFHDGTLSTPSPSSAEIQLAAAADAWWRDRPVRLRVGPPAADAEGIAMAAAYETVFFPGGGDLAGGFLSGEVYDDTTGRPFAGAQARLYASGASLPGAVEAGAESTAVASAVSDGRGRFVLTGEVPAGRYVLMLGKEEATGTTRVYRRLSLRPSAGLVPFDARLTPLAEPAIDGASTTLDPASGGTVTGVAGSSAAAFSFAADAAALPGSEPVTVRLTPRSGQGLPDFLPLGWTPAVAADVRLTVAGASGEIALPEQDLWTLGAARVTLPLPAWVEEGAALRAARYEAATGRWIALPSPEILAGPTRQARVDVAGPGTVAIVLADEAAAIRPPLPAGDGEPLQGSAAPSAALDWGASTALLTLDPPVVPPTGRSRARVVAHTQDGSVWPSGVAVQAYLDERLVLTGGGEVLEAPFAADLVLYHPALAPAEQGTAPEGSAGAMEFAVSPSPRAAQVLLEVGWENIRLFPFPEDVERGPVVGPDGGVVDTEEGVELIVPEGALGAKVPVSAQLLTAAELAALPAVAGYDTLAAVRVDFSGATLARPATLSLPTPDGSPAETAAPASSARVILGELIEAPADARGAFAKLASRTRREGAGAAERVVASPDLAAPLPLDGIVREGLYLVLAAHQPLGFATGFVRGAGGATATPVANARVEAAGLGTADLSAIDGRYAVPVEAGTDRALAARHPARDERGTATIPSLQPGEVVAVDLAIQSVPPRILSLAPLDGAVDQPLATPVSILWSEPLDPSTVTSSTLRLELLDGAGRPSGVRVDGTVSLVDGVRVLFAPARPLLQSRRYVAHFTGGVADAGGTIYVGPPVDWTFATAAAAAPGGQVHPEKFHIRVPVAGVAEIYGDPGALPGSPAGSTPWAVSPEIEGPVADPLRETFQGRADGSFSGTAGHPPQFAVSIASKVWVKVFDPTGALAAEFRLGPFTTPDGLGFVAQPGEALTFHSAEGLVVDVPAAAFEKATLVRVQTLPAANVGIPTPTGLALGAFIHVDFDGEAKETLRVSVPAPADASSDAQVFIGKPVSLSWGRRLQVLSIGGVLERDGQPYLSNDPSVQPEPAVGTFSGASSEASRAATGGPVARDERADREPKEQARGLGQTSRGDLRSLAAAASGRTCRNAIQDGLPKCFLQSVAMEFTLRSDAAFYYEQGAQWTALIGGATPFPLMSGIQQEAIYNFLADSWVYLPVPHDWNGGFVLPVLSQEPLELVRRDTATGWILGRQVYDPIAGADDLVDIGFLGGGQPSRPMLLDARPFQLHRLPAPPGGASERLSLELEVRSDGAALVTVATVDGYPPAEGTSVALYDLAPLSPVDPDAEPSAPVAGPVARACGADPSIETQPMAGSDDLLVVVGPGGLDASSLDTLELQFDQTLEDVSEKPAADVARLWDLGPLADCAAPTAAGYPKELPVQLEQTDRRSRLLVRPDAALAAGHRFRLDLVPSGIAVEVPNQARLTYWETAPTRFEFATREVPGDPIAGLPDSPALGTTSVARDMLKLGNLLIVASETGDLVAVDVSRASDPEGLRRHAVKNRGVQSATRSLATDGHNRIFYSGLFGSTWAIKTLRLEDIREAGAACASPPEWAAGLPCFEGVEGSVRIAYALGSTTGTTASEWLAAGALPEGTPMRLAVLAQDEKGKTLEAADFVHTYAPGQPAISSLSPDAEGIYTFDVALRSSYARAQAGEREPSLDPDDPNDAPEPAVAEWRTKVCDGEEDYDRYQRVTIDNLTTGQSWSADVENPWPEGGNGDGNAVVSGVRARRGDVLRVRYNLRALGHAAILGSGITVVDLDRFYRLPQPYQSAGGGQCGRRLGKFEGQALEFPSCAPAGAELSGIAMTPSVVTQSATGCASGQCRGEGFIDIYSPLQRIGALHTRSTVDAPGGVEANGALDSTENPDALQFADLAACMQTIAGQPVFLRDVALANDVEWLANGITGQISGSFQLPPAGTAATRLHGDLLFVSLGVPGVYVFDVSARSLAYSAAGKPALIGRLAVKNHTAFRLDVDPVRGLLFAGGTDTATGQPVIDVWDLASVNGAPGLRGEPAPVATLDAPWSTDHLGIDTAGTGLVYTWGSEDGPLVVPFDRPQFVFSGLYRPEGETAERGIAGEQKATTRFVPLGIPLETSLAAERDNRNLHEEKATAAFKLRVALPGSLGPELTAKVQSLRALPGPTVLGREDIGPSVQPPGGPGWPENEVVVRLRRVGTGSDEGDTTRGESGQLGGAYPLYESVETVLLLADPRARHGYRLQDAAGEETADERAQCRRCEWPGYLPDPLGSPSALANVEELLAGRYVRAFLYPSSEAGETTRQATQAALAFFETAGANYPLPAGYAEIAGPADAVPSPIQVALAEPAQNPAMWNAGEAGVAASLAGGELLVAATDHHVESRAIPFALDRTYRSSMLGHGPLGSAGWSSPLYAHLRELPSTAEVEYHDGMGHVWRFLPRSLPEPPSGYEDDDAGSYHAPQGVYLRLQRLAGGQGWRLIGRQHDTALFDGEGRLVELGDRHRKGGTAGEQGSVERLRYDAFGQLSSVEDDLGRRYAFTYHDDPRPESQGGDGPRYGLLESVEDFAQRTVEYRYDAERRLTEVLLPEVSNSVAEYAEFSYTGANRPKIVYHYDPAQGASKSDANGTAILHGEFAPLRLGSIELPQFLSSSVPRARFEYEETTGRLHVVGFPTRENQNTSTSSVKWELRVPGATAGAGPASAVEIVAPWGHVVNETLEHGRTVTVREELEILRAGTTPSVEPVETRYAYTEDGRLLSVTRPDGSRVSQCYADGEHGEGCSVSSSGAGDRLMKANVLGTSEIALEPAAQGSASYGSISTGASYDADNLVEQVQDGESRPIELAVPAPNASDATKFAAEAVVTHFDYDAYGRVKESRGGGEGAPVMRLGYGADARGHQGAGLPSRLERGGAFWQALSYDDSWNVKRIDTSQGASSEVERDEWNRPVKTAAGLAQDGRLAEVGAGSCTEGKGSLTEQAYDAAGHVVRERRLQDYVDPQDHATKCRWVERRYRYNAREQLAGVEETHLASPTAPGTVTAAPQPTQAVEYDEHGRIEREISKALTHPDVVKTYAYDPAGRVASVRTGQEGPRRLGYDERSRVVFATDGDEGVWRGRYDAWGRLFREDQPTGAIVVREYDKAGNPTAERTYDGDPSLETAKLLAEARMHVTSFGSVERTTQTLTAATETEPATYRVAEKVFDPSGRPTEIWSGPGLSTDPTRVDRDHGRRDLILEYEPESGRLIRKRIGGDATTGPLHEEVYLYAPESSSPWPDAVRNFESIPGQTDLVETFTTTFRRDALGREIESKRSDGTSLQTVYDRTGGAIRARTGAGTETASSQDGRGLQIQSLRPNGRGFTQYAYDIDGSLIQEATATAQAQLWETSYAHDATGRIQEILYADGTRESLTYNSDSTVATHRTRDGLLITYTYDPANRLKTAVPAVAQGATSPTGLDAGDGRGYDALSRIVEMTTGRAGVSGFDPALGIRREAYDLGSRPGREILGAREPLAWSYDVWDNASRVTLPEVPGRDAAGAFAGFSRTYDSLDRLTDASGLGAAGLSPTALGAMWVWGGANRLYAMTTKGAIQTAVRYGYHAGAGPQLPGQAAAGSEWKLATMTWGGAGSAGATSAPQTAWGSFGYGYRGNEGTPSDGAKIGRQVFSSLAAASSPDLLAGMGWSWQYDAGVRLGSASAGDGDILGRAPPAGSGAEVFHFEYGEGDELERTVREASGEISERETGVYGRIVSRKGFVFGYDGAGRRIQDDRQSFKWNWRGQLITTTIQPSVASPYAGHQLRSAYDAAGRLTERWHYGKLPEGSSDDGERPFIEKRIFVWEGDRLAAEAAYGQEGTEASLRWRKVYVPGPSGLDDAPQVVVEQAGVARTFSFLRDELGTVIAVVAEDESTDPQHPKIVARYRYTPYGEAHVETGPEILRARMESDVVSVNGTAQAIVDERSAAPGALVIDWSVGIAEASLAAGVVVERLDGSSGWVALGSDAVVAVGGDTTQIVTLPLHGWLASTSYRVRVLAQLRDTVGREFGGSESFDFRTADAPASGKLAAVRFEKEIPTRFDSAEAAANTLGGRFPGGQTSLFQGLWTDPVSGISYARARWYDARTASWLSEDPLSDVDSQNLYAFVGWAPHRARDPLGLQEQEANRQWGNDVVDWLAETVPIRWLREKLGWVDTKVEELAQVADSEARRTFQASLGDSRGISRADVELLAELDATPGRYVTGVSGAGADAVLKEGVRREGGALVGQAARTLTREGIYAAGGVVLGKGARAVEEVTEEVAAARRAGGALSDGPFAFFNRAHTGAAPSPRGLGPHGAPLQSHHGLQRQWARENLAGFGYDPDLAPTVTMETGAGYPHTIITNRQNARRLQREARGRGKWSTSLEEELGFIVSDYRAAGFDDDVIEGVLQQQYRMLDTLNVPYQPVPLTR